MSPETQTVPVWDIAVRVFHWSLVLTFFVAYVAGDELETVHVYAGYAVTGLIIFRIFWGFLGSRYARFSSFVTGPSAVIQHLKQMRSGNPDHYLGHNPAAGAMVLALLITLSLTGFSGLKLYGVEGHGPLAQDLSVSIISNAMADDDDREYGEHADEEAEEFWEEIHEFAVNLSLLLIFLHVLGVMASSHLEGQNLARAMVTGQKNAPHETSRQGQ